MRNSALAQWIVQGVSVLAFLVLVTYLASYLPEEGILGAARKVIAKH